MTTPTMTPQAYPLYARVDFRSGDPLVTALIIGWHPVTDPHFDDTTPGARYTPVVVLPDDHAGAWPLPNDGSVSWRIIDPVGKP